MIIKSLTRTCIASLVIGFISTGAASAQENFENIEALRDSAQQQLTSHLKNLASSSNKDITVKMLPLDSRLRLTRCDTAVDYQIVTPVAAVNTATVKISCNGLNHWSLYAPAQIAVFGDTAVAAHSLERGSIIQPEDIHFVRQNLNQIGANYVDSTALVIGQALKRSVREGEPLRTSYLEQPKIIQRGDRVTLEAQALGLNVAAPGLAMANGMLGERIQVKNAQSNKIVDALVIAPGRVRVKYE